MSIEPGVNYPSTRLEQAYAVKKIGDLKYVGIRPLAKPSLTSRGVFGGNLCAQLVIAALETVPIGFTPHSLHSYFVKAASPDVVCEHHVERISDGKLFANRQVRVMQNNELKYIVIVSLTKKNLSQLSKRDYERNKLVLAPIEFQKAVPQDFYQHNHEELELRVGDPTHTVHHKFPPKFLDHRLGRDELAKPAGDRELSFWIKVDSVKGDPEAYRKYKYAGLAVISDLLVLTSLSRVLHLVSDREVVTGGKGAHFFLVSLDHSIYFHDDDFDPTSWTFFNFRTPRLANNRALVQGEYYDQNGKMVASIVQEGLVFFHSGHELKAKL